MSVSEKRVRERTVVVWRFAKLYLVTVTEKLSSELVFSSYRKSE